MYSPGNHGVRRFSDTKFSHSSALNMVNPLLGDLDLPAAREFDLGPA